MRFFVKNRLAYKLMRYCVIFVTLSVFTLGFAHAISTIIKDGGTRWYKGGSPSNWSIYYQGGYNNSSFHHTLNSQYSASEYGRWYAHVNSICSIDAFIPGSNSATRSASYYVNNGSSYYLAKTVDQYNALFWTQIENYLNCSTPSVYLYDNTGETAATTSVFYDEIRINF